MLRPAPSTPVGVVAQLSALALHAEKIPDLLRGLPADDPKTAARTAEAVMWADGLCAAVVDHLRSVATLMPWAVLLASDTKGALANTELAALTSRMPSIADLPDMCGAAIAVLARRCAERTAVDPLEDALIDGFRSSAKAAADLSGRLLALCEGAHKLFNAMEFGFLFDPERELLSIGYRVADGSLDPNYYDLLASEARLASFVAIAKGDLPTRHWFRLGRTLTPIGYGASADLMVRVDVRISDAVAGHARAGRKPARADQPPGRAAADEIRRQCATCPGASRSPPTTRATSSSPINIRASASRSRASSGASATIPSSRHMRRRLRR